MFTFRLLAQNSNNSTYELFVKNPILDKNWSESQLRKRSSFRSEGSGEQKLLELLLGWTKRPKKGQN